MWFSVQSNGVGIGTVDLPVGLLVTARLEPSTAYDGIASVVLDASTAFFQLGIFGAAAPLLPPIATEARRLRRAMSMATRLRLELVNARGEIVRTNFVNLVASTANDGVVVLASFLTAEAAVGSVAMFPLATGGESRR